MLLVPILNPVLEIGLFDDWIEEDLDSSISAL